jgi:hypothetical protein
LGYAEYPYSENGLTYYDIPVQTEYEHPILSDFQRNKMLDDSIDYLMQNPVQQNYVKYQDYKDPGMDYGQKIWDPEAREYRNNPQAMANIHRMHGEGDDYWLEDWNKLYGSERYAPASVPIPHHDRPAGYQDLQPNWAYINALENFKEYGGDIRMMNTADMYKDIDKWIMDPEGNYIRNPEANVGGVNVGADPTGTGGYFRSSTGNITLNPANVVKKYPTAPMGPDSEWEFLGPNEVNVNTPYFDPLRVWNLGRILPHETGHFQEDVDEIMGWDEPNPGAYLEGTKWGSYADHHRHPRMHMMDRAQWDWRDDNDKSLSKTQFANLKADQARSMNESLNRPYWGDDKTFEQDWERAGQGFGGSGRSRENRSGMWQDPSTTNTLREQAIQNKYQSPPQRDRSTHHFDDGGIAGLPGQWSPSTITGDEEIYDIKPLQMDPGIMSIDDLEDLFEEAGLDKRIIYDLINTGGLSQLVS